MGEKSFVKWARSNSSDQQHFDIHHLLQNYLYFNFCGKNLMIDIIVLDSGAFWAPSYTPLNATVCGVNKPQWVNDGLIFV